MTSQPSQILEFGPKIGIVCGSGQALNSVNSVVAEIARTNIPVLLTGESGTGKDVCARLIHRLSANSAKLMKKVNCASLRAENFSEQIWESVHPKARDRDSGIGTLFLDQVDELDLNCQRALLSLLPDGEAESDEPEFSARLISATSYELEREVESGQFRRELYFRINGVSLRLPPLRERKEELPALLDSFLEEFSRELKRKRPEVSKEEMEILMSHEWPGNIRELQNIAKMMIVLGGARPAIGELRSVPPSGLASPRTDKVSSLKVAARAASRRTERELILKALERTRWNRKRAAQELQISYKSLLYKLKQIGIPESESREEV